MSTRDRRILTALGLLLLVAVAYLAGRLAFPELWPWFCDGGGSHAVAVNGMRDRRVRLIGGREGN